MPIIQEERLWYVAEGGWKNKPRTLIMHHAVDGDEPANDPIIAELWDAEEPILHDDARLLAAAPKLLKALKLGMKFVAKLSADGGPTSLFASRALNVMKDTVDEVEGKI